MIAFRTTLNGEYLATSGVRTGVSTVSAVIRQGLYAPPDHLCLWYDIGGLDRAADEFIGWKRDAPLQTGDCMVVEIVDAPEIDPPGIRRPAKDPAEGGLPKGEEDDEPEPPQRWDFPFPAGIPVLGLKVGIHGRPEMLASRQPGVAMAMFTFQWLPQSPEDGACQATCDLWVAGLMAGAGEGSRSFKCDLAVGDVVTLTVVEMSAEEITQAP